MADDTATLEDAIATLQADATAEGRCPYCGRRHDDDNDRLFKTLRDELATARTERDDLRRDLEAAQESNERYVLEVEGLKKKLVEASQ